MPKFEMSIEIDEDLVLKHLGYNSKKKNYKYTISEINNVLHELQTKNIIRPVIFYNRFNMKSNSKDDSILLDNGMLFQGDYIFNALKEADEIFVVVATIGSEIDKTINNYSNMGEHLKSLIADTAGVCALNLLNKAFWAYLVDMIKKEHIGITKKIYPGVNDWSIKDQRKIFDLLRDDIVGLQLNDSYMIEPIKSDTCVYGIGKDLGISLKSHYCSDCNLTNCLYRNIGNPETHELTINYGDDIKVIEVKDGENLYKALVNEGVFVRSDCNGKGVCKKCKVKLDEHLPITNEELQFLSEDEIKKGYRLACYVDVNIPMSITVDNGNSTFNILVEEYFQNYSINSNVISGSGFISKPTINNQVDDIERIKESIELDDIIVPFEILKKVPKLLKGEDSNVSYILYGNELIYLDNSIQPKEPYGIAIDIGTTTIAAYLVNLKSGQTVDIYSSINPQVKFGTDVITRIQYMIENEKGLEELNNLINNEINKTIEHFIRKNNINKNCIHKMTVVGNTTMIHLFLGLNCRNISNAPYVPVTTSSYQLKAKDLGININPEGYIILLPCSTGSWFISYFYIFFTKGISEG